MSAGLLFDATKCIGCGGCTAACKEEHELPLPIEDRTTAATWTTVQKRAGVWTRTMCMHCLTPTCVSVCPVGAMQKTARGAVVYDAEKCIGCRYCMMACPFGIPKYQWDRPVPIVGKCVMCAERLADGKQPACATVCPTGATTFGERDTLLADARERIRQSPQRYVPHVYGSDEAGGTAVMYLSSVPFAKLGLPENLPRQPLSLLTWQVLGKIPDYAMMAGAFLYGIHWLTRRRMQLAAEANARAARPAGRAGA